MPDFLAYKAIIDIDGNSNAWSGLYWKLLSNSAVLKVCKHYALSTCMRVGTHTYTHTHTHTRTHTHTHTHTHRLGRAD